MNLLLAFYIVGAVLNFVLMVTLREAFTEVVSNYKITKSESYSQHNVAFLIFYVGCI